MAEPSIVVHAVHDARVMPSGVSVWVIIKSLKVHGGDVDLVRREYGLSKDEIVKALAYYGMHWRVIDAQIVLSDA